MATLPQLIPDADVLLALPPEELAETLLALADSSKQNGMFSAANMTGDQTLFGTGIPGPPVYPRHMQHQIEEALGEAWLWLELNMLIMPASGINGRNGWKVLTRRGRAMLADHSEFKGYLAAAGFPKSMLHSSIRDAVWLDLARGDFETAVFRSFKAVEEAVRAAGKFDPEDVGVDLVRKGFNAKNGPLRRDSDPVAEREALANLFAGAIGSYKNPHSHRTKQLEAQEAREMVALASHLLGIVDARRP
jgi:uncharacterized protein (TIGR02391 family)